jgi:Flp pilus assembly protein TadB
VGDDQESSAGLLGVAVAAVGVCCGLPLLLGAGVAVGAISAVLGSAVVVAAGSAAAVWGWRRHRRRAAACPADSRRGDVREGG